VYEPGSVISKLYGDLTNYINSGDIRNHLPINILGNIKEGMTVENLQALLKERNVPFELIDHDVAIRTAQEGAAYFGINVGQTAPTLILKTDKGFFALIMSGDRGHIDFEEVASILGCKKLKLAGAREVKKVTGFSVGSISMVGHNLPCIIDKRLLQYSHIYGGSGKETCTLKVNPNELKKLNRVVAILE
jgi:Cys-tRNA(Pro)/Cys-tRNA(Cys) deacylase